MAERRRAEEEVLTLNASLAQRAAELEASNKELEAFAYSVSHDLRAPLRGIDGFAQALLEDCAGGLDATGRQYLGLVRQNAQRMSRLIDDLLAFSRVGRQALRTSPVQLDGVVQRAWEELGPDRAGRLVELRVGDLPACQGDPALLKQVFINLLGNALKFSRARSPAIVEVGCQDGQGGGAVYYVKDNGIGFDMQYVDQVFGVFQRLHRAEEYEGTGVGLAIVQRVIQRHGGRIWAEAAVGQGAAFYFTLGADALR
jgi:light-regulated signal transduction histidine kinase (bacteriophytochrome)